MSSDSSSDASYVPTSDVDYYSDDSDLVHDAEGVSEEEIVPDGEEDPEGFGFVIPFDKKTPTCAMMIYQSSLRLMLE